MGDEMIPYACLIGGRVHMFLRWPSSSMHADSVGSAASGAGGGGREPG